MTGKPFIIFPGFPGAVRFVDEYLRHDGVLLIRLLELNANRLVTTEIISAMWSHFKVNRPNHKLLKRSKSENVAVEV